MNVLLTSKIGALQGTVFKIQAHPPKCVEKNMLKACNLGKNKLCYRYFDHNLRKILWANILDNGTD